MVTLKDEISKLRANPQEFFGKKVRGNYWEETMEILAVIPQDDGFSIVFSSLDHKLTSPLYLTNDRLGDIEVINLDFGGNSQLFFLAIMGKILRNNYESDPYFAVGISNIDPLPHQLDAVYNHILQRGRLRFMIADDPGAGKTIMAGLVIKEYLYRGLAKKILIIAPGGLTSQWEEEMRSKFNEEFIVVDRGVVNAYRHKNVWLEHPKVITGLDFAKQSDILDTLKESSWDLVVVDEAHKFSGIVDKDVFQANMRYELGEVICNCAFNVLFLTATPHKGDDQAFRMLLSLLEPQLFGDRHVLYAPEVNEQVRSLEEVGLPIFIRRLKETMITMDKKPIFTLRRSVTTTFTISEMETELYRAVSKYVAENFNMALKNRRTAVTFALKIMQKRLLSSSHAIYNTLKNRATRLQEILDNDEFKKSQTELDAMEKQFQAQLELEWEDMSESEREKLEHKILQLSMAKNPAELQAEIELLQQLQVLAQKVVENPSQETKLWELKKLLDNHLRDPQEKIIVFTEFKDTLDFLQEQLASWGYSISIIHGGMSKDERLNAQDRFRHQTQVLVATEAAGEGINLQFCHLLINYDIPWTPTRLEQRLGRIHRYGQKKECFFFNLVSNHAADGKPIVEGQVLSALLLKIEAIKEALRRDRVYDIIGSEIFANLSLENVFTQVITDPNGFFKIQAQIEGKDLEKQVEETLARVKENMTVNLDKVFVGIDKSKDARLWPEYIEKYITLALDQFNGTLAKTGRLQIPSVLRDFDTKLPNYYELVTFKKPGPEELERTPGIAYIAPGHALLEDCFDYALEKAGADLYRGTVLTDPVMKRFGLLWCLEQGIEDGTPRVIGRTVGIVFQTLDAQLQPSLLETVPAMKLWDFEPIKKTLQVQLPFNLTQYTQKVTEYFHTNQGKEYYDKVSSVNDRLGTIRRTAAKTAYDHQRGYVSKHILQLKQRLKSPTLSEKTRTSLEGQMTRARNEREALEKRYQEQEILLTRQNTLTPHIPRVLGVALIVPATEKGDLDLPVLLDATAREKRLHELTDKRLVEEAAMRVATTFEENQRHCKVTPTAKINCGYDLESVNPTNPTDIRRIEVKGHKGMGDTYISNNELTMGLRHGDTFWLYVVENALSANPRIRIVQNPALKFMEKLDVVKSTRFILSQEDLEKQSEIIEI